VSDANGSLIVTDDLQLKRRRDVTQAAAISP
jgi:hypothetical protein